MLSSIAAGPGLRLMLIDADFVKRSGWEEHVLREDIQYVWKCFPYCVSCFSGNTVSLLTALWCCILVFGVDSENLCIAWRCCRSGGYVEI